MIKLTDTAICTGCAACKQVCSAGAVSMQEDKEGFLFPNINEKLCVSCKKCMAVCPVLNSTEEIQPKAVYAARAKDETVCFSSSSGGAFGTLAKAITDRGGVVFGAGFDENHQVVHMAAESLSDVAPLRGSKYVQSDVKDTYKEVKSYLAHGRQVMFAGTPCQCAGLVGFLGKKYDNLLLVDFVCHGVPSPGLFDNYLEYMGGKDSISKVRFRDKTTDKKNGHCISIEYKSGEIYRVVSVKDPFMLAFLQNISLRKSCYNCSFKNFKSGSDITIGDFWGIDKTDSVVSSKDGVSLVAVNTEKGKIFFDCICDVVEYDRRTLEEALKDNPSIKSSTRHNPLRDKYLKDMHKMSINKLNDKYCSNSIGAKLRRFIAKI